MIASEQEQEGRAKIRYIVLTWLVTWEFMGTEKVAVSLHALNVLRFSGTFYLGKNLAPHRSTPQSINCLQFEHATRLTDYADELNDRRRLFAIACVGEGAYFVVAISQDIWQAVRPMMERNYNYHVWDGYQISCICIIYNGEYDSVHSQCTAPQ